jgi:hypothetical protein
MATTKFVVAMTLNIVKLRRLVVNDGDLGLFGHRGELRSTCKVWHLDLLMCYF